MNTEQAKLGRIQAIVDASEGVIWESKKQIDKVNAAITAYEHIVKILREDEDVNS